MAMNAKNNNNNNKNNKKFSNFAKIMKMKRVRKESLLIIVLTMPTTIEKKMMKINAKDFCFYLIVMMVNVDGTCG